MKISIIGSNGFLSTAIARYCNERGWKIDVYGLVAPLNHQYDRFYYIDLMKDNVDVHNLLDSTMVIYAAGAGIQSNKRDDTSMIFRLNVGVPVNICNELKKNSFEGIMITFGSYFEIGEINSHRAFTEEEILSSISPAPNEYVISKRMFSCFVSSYKHPFRHWHFYLPTIYGEGENPIRLIPYTINSIRSNNPIKYTSGFQTRQYIYVNDLPDLLFLSVDKNLPSGVYNVPGKETLTVREIVTLIHLYFERDVPENCFGAEQRDDVGMSYLALNCEKLTKLTGFSPSTCLKDVIKLY